MPRIPLNILKLLEQLSPEFQQLVQGRGPRGVRPGTYQFEGDVSLGGLTFSDEALALQMQRKAEELLKQGPLPVEQAGLLRGANILASNVKGRKALRSRSTKETLVKKAHIPKEGEQGPPSKVIATRATEPKGERGVPIIDPDDNRPDQVRLREALGERNIVSPEEIEKFAKEVLGRKGASTPSLKFRQERIAKGKDVNVLLRPGEMQEILNAVLLSRLSNLRGALPKGGGTLRLPSTDPAERVAIMRASRYGASGGRKPILGEQPSTGERPIPTGSLGYYLRGGKIQVGSDGKLMIAHSKAERPVDPTDLIKQLEAYAPQLSANIAAQRAALRKIRGGTPQSKAAARQLGELERLEERIPKIIRGVQAAVRNAERETKLPITSENLMGIEEAAARRNERSAARRKGTDDNRHFDSPEESLERVLEESGAVEGASRKAATKKRRDRDEADLKIRGRVDKLVGDKLKASVGPRPSKVPSDIQGQRKLEGRPPVFAKDFKRLAKLGDIKKLGVTQRKSNEMTPFEASRSSREYLESVGGSRFRSSQLERVRTPEAAQLANLGKQVIQSMDSPKSMRGGLRDTAAKFLKMERMADELVKKGALDADNAKSILNRTIESLMRTEGGDTVVRMLQKHAKPETYRKIVLVPQPKPDKRRPATGRVPAGTGKSRAKRQGPGPKEAPTSREIVETPVAKGEFQPRTPTEQELIEGFKAWRKERAEQRAVGIDPDRPLRTSLARGGKAGIGSVVELTDEGNPLKTLQEMLPKSPPQKAGRPVQGPKQRTVLTPEDIKAILRIAREKRKKGTYTGIRRPTD